MPAKYPTKLFLSMKSGGRCALKDCRKILTSDGVKSDPAVIGEAAHIYGENKTAARYKEDMTETERNHYNNLIYLCPSCHTKIDRQEKDFPAEFLFQIKKEHEDWVNDQLDESMSEVTFAELEIATKAIALGIHYESTDFAVIPPEDKIKKNNLSSGIRVLVMAGLSRSSEVQNYFIKQSQLDDEFIDRIKNGFIDKYQELRNSLKGDELFMAMYQFANGKNSDFKLQAAALAILVHLFNLCDIFEK